MIKIAIIEDSKSGELACELNGRARVDVPQLSACGSQSGYLGRYRHRRQAEQHPAHVQIIKIGLRHLRRLVHGCKERFGNSIHVRFSLSPNGRALHGV